jgi:hypothetical protein
MTSLVIATLEATSGGQEPTMVKAHGLGHHQADDRASGQAVTTAGIKPPDLVRRKENRDGMHVFD